jgi:hypothetical protein
MRIAYSQRLLVALLNTCLILETHPEILIDKVEMNNAN